MTAGCGSGDKSGNSGPRRGHGPGGGGGRDQAEEAIAVAIASIQREPISALYSTSATLRADRQATVIARTRGVVRQLAVEEGDQVGMDQPLAYLEDDEQKIAAARARTTRDTARREHERVAGLYEQSLVSLDEFEKTRRDADDADHALALAELELSRTVIRAPFKGVILRRHLDVGATVADGTAVYDLADLDPLYADINIPERHVQRLAPGQRVLLAADTESEPVPAAIERIAPLVDSSTGTVKVTVAVEGGSTLRPGAFVRVDIVTDTRQDALVVPRSALVAEGRRWHLYRLKEDRATVEQLEVKIGFESGDRIELAELVSDTEDLMPGQDVVVKGAPALSDGATIRDVADEEHRAKGQESDADTQVESSAGGA
jgi:membrane fusion protein (multidrug efflux system)